MKILSLGTGEAFDPDIPNNSHLVMTQQANVLLDCGYSIPQQWFKLGKGGNFLDAIYISHKHWDHYGGLPVLLMWMWQQERTKPLLIICPEWLEDFLRGLMETAYQGFQQKFQYEIVVWGFKPADRNVYPVLGLGLSFAPTIHSTENLAIRIDDLRSVVCYSGDGQFTRDTEKLYEGANLLIQETFLYDERREGHASIKDAIVMAERQGIKRLALTHLQRDFRRNQLLGLMDKIRSEKVDVSVPLPFHEYDLGE